MGVTLSAAFVIGAALSVSGATLQGLLRNPLAEPYMLGMVGGGALFVALATVLGLTAWGAFVLPAASLAGSCCSLLLVLAVARFARRVRDRKGADAAMRSAYDPVIVAGFVVGGFTGSLDMLALSFAKADDFASVSKWLYGSLANVTPQALALGAGVLAVVLVVLFALRRPLDVMELGHDEAACLGVNVRGTMIAAIAAVSLATSVSVALAGAVGFVGLVVPHAVRRLFGVRQRAVVPFSALFGGVFLVLAQLLVGFVPADVPVGVVCAAVGAPFFLVLLSTTSS